MIAGHHQAAAGAPESRDGGAIFRRQPVALIDGEQPELGEVRFVDGGENRIGLAQRIAVARRHLEQRMAMAILQPRQMIAQQAEAADMPAILE